MNLLKRGGECRFLSRLFASPPDAEVLQDAEHLGLVDFGWQNNLESLQVEYSQLFSVPGSQAIASHQSLYTDILQLEPSQPNQLRCGLAFTGGEFPGYLGGKSCSELKRWYAAVDFVPPDQGPAMVDHIAAQLAFLAHLYCAEHQSCQFKDKKSARIFRQLRKAFYARFLGRWIEIFAKKLVANTVSEFYRCIGKRMMIQFNSPLLPPSRGRRGGERKQPIRSLSETVP